MISITYPEGNKNLSKEELLLLQKACHKAYQDVKDKIYDLRVYYKPNEELLEKLREELAQYLNLRQIFEDLENLYE